jgi:hypothetical protein
VAPPLGLAVLLTIFLGATRLLPAMAGSHTPIWPGGVVRVFAEGGTGATVATAAARWTTSGADVDIVMVRRERDADVIVRSDDRRLLHLCGPDCLGFSSAIGRPAHGRGEVLLLSRLGGQPRALSVWVAAHELGHVLGLHHRSGKRCSVMSPHAFDTLCAPSLADGKLTAAEVECVPAPADVDVAAGLYGGGARIRDPLCR